jgi:GAF domain-containing protein
MEPGVQSKSRRPDSSDSKDEIDIIDFMLGTYHLSALFEILNKLHFVYEPPKLWRYVLDQACKTVQAEAGTYFELSEDEKEMQVKAAFGMDESRLGEVPFRMGEGIVGWAAQYHQPALVPDVRVDNRFNKRIDLVTGFNTRSILCVPVFSQKRTYGVLEVLNRKGGQFSPQDQEFMTLLGRQAAIAYQNLLLIDEVSHTKTLLESLLLNLTGGLIAVDLVGKITIFNPAAASILHLPEGPHIGTKSSEVLREFPWFMKTLEETLAAKSTVSRQETILTIQGKPAKLGYTTILIRDPLKTVLGSGIIFQRLNS